MIGIPLNASGVVAANQAKQFNEPGIVKSDLETVEESEMNNSDCGQIFPTPIRLELKTCNWKLSTKILMKCAAPQDEGQKIGLATRAGASHIFAH
jgi:hypothetical protein